MDKLDVGKHCYLIVDDDEISREALGGTLTHLGATRIFLADNASTAEQLARQHSPDFILLDIYMPKVDGWALLSTLRRAAPQAAILMVTGLHRPEDFRQSMQERVDGFCIKPVLPDLMAQNLHNAKTRRDSARTVRRT